jgi:RNA polymerase sigma-70 factor (ECF subfamily)
MALATDSGTSNLRVLSTTTTEELVSQAQQGDPDAFGELCQRYRSMSYKLAFRVLRRPEDVEDIVQESLLRAFTGLSSFKREAKFSTWLARIVINTSFMYFRKDKSARFCPLDELVDAERGAKSMFTSFLPSPESAYQLVELLHHLRHEVDRLPPILRDIMVDRLSRDISISEAAHHAHLSVGAVKSRLMRARVALTSSMRSHFASTDLSAADDTKTLGHLISRGP